jgi:hypothetical protein
MYITKTITIIVHATADDWQLYDLPGRDDAAIALNQRFEALVNKRAMRSKVRNGMCLSGYANLGAADTEVRHFVEDLLDRTFGEQ